ncbi:GNAT family protein [Sagittula salina]|uniref:GNAT family N-acetyltransferase n=1 Tax=Sagittula salina TaxID=2820268 RepID=A0A940MNC9_9RHOB|nr:GNAT family protein [Sagittula salina]MBP0484676.1 GNAT family N-acetyltransferase [Sagittula salina]
MLAVTRHTTGPVDMTLGITLADQKAIKAWAAPRCDMGSIPESAWALAVVEIETGTLRAACILYEVYKGEVDVHFASDGDRRWATRDILTAMFFYAFHHMDARILKAVIAARNVPALVMALKSGWQVQGRVQGVLSGGADGILLTLAEPDCVYLKGDDHGRQE